MLELILLGKLGAVAMMVLVQTIDEATAPTAARPWYWSSAPAFAARQQSRAAIKLTATEEEQKKQAA